MSKHPYQPIYLDEKECVRFKENKLIRMMYDICAKNGFSLNEMFKENLIDDYKQLLQLMGYPLAGYLEYNFPDEDVMLLKLVEEAIKNETIN